MELIGHEHILRFFDTTITKGQLNHAYLFVGPVSIGKTLLMQFLAERILCENARGNDGCISCISFAKTAHPDFSLVDPDTNEARETIPIATIREITRWVYLRPAIGRIKVQAVAHADRLNIEAANAFLKVLEDPPPHTLFFLSAESLGKLPATLRSRTQRFRCLPSPTIHAEERSTDTIEQWCALLREPSQIFSFVDREIEKLDVCFFLTIGRILVHDLLRIHWQCVTRLLQLVSEKDNGQNEDDRHHQEKYRAFRRRDYRRDKIRRTRVVHESP